MTETTISGIPCGQQEVDEKIVSTVLASFEDTADPRLKLLMQSLSRHLHAFIP